MGWWEETHISADMRYLLKLYTRYIDDLLCVWQGEECSFLAFVQVLNHNKLNLRFASEYRRETIEFLDIKLMAVDKRKPCSGNTLLHASSCHPKNLIGGIPVVQFQRLQRNCSTDVAFREQEEAMKERYQRAKGTGVSSIPRRSHTLRDLLSPSMHSEKNKGDRIGNMGLLRVKGCYKCGSSKCITCQRLKISKEFKSTVTSKSFKIRDYINTSTVVYLATCLKRQKQYVGCTNRTLKERIREHLSQIKNSKALEKSNITRHFAQCNGNDIGFFFLHMALKKLGVGKGI
ncbi:hypothetical protein XELAEV_18023370mg [Xenopus laevis]|uniref:GIY-YIG domain-containing protein n=1 Tax=Xenopus laevis TaxID=8355 RepID=A0A974HP92_XENLA|nr:hypothetical protein XELAEV_18023370mg [Xenopus laevis]